MAHANSVSLANAIAIPRFYVLLIYLNNVFSVFLVCGRCGH